MNEVNFQYAGVFDGAFSDGFLPAAKRAARAQMREARVAEATKLWLDVIEGGQDPYLLRQAFNPTSSIAAEMLCRRYPVLFNENMGTSDFSALTADVLDRMLLGNYAATPETFRLYCKVRTLRDFRDVKRFAVDGAEKPWSSVPELVGHDRQKLSQGTPYTYAPLKYLSGAEPISWEAMVNDDLGIFTDLPQRFIRGAVRTKEKFATSLFCSSTGPDSTLYSVGNGNIVTSNPVFSNAAMGTALGILMGRTDSGGDPIMIPGTFYLVHPPALYNAVQNWVNQVTVDVVEAGGTTNQTVRVNNWIIQNVKPIMNPYLPIIDTTRGNTAWYLFADPNANGRPALEVGELRGYEAPVILEKAPETMRGGSLVPELGSWETMAREMKGLVVFGGAQMDPKTTVASSGAGS